jgi:hypothetical protein
MDARVTSEMRSTLVKKDEEEASGIFLPCENFVFCKIPISVHVMKTL